MTPDETMQADNQTVEAPPAPETSQEEQSVSPEAEQLFEAFQSAENETNVKIAKQQDNIDRLNEKIKQTEASQSRQFQTVAACEEVLKSNAYPKLSPLISAFSERTKKSAERKNDKIASLKKKVKKAQKKMKRLKRKQQKNKLLKAFVSSLFDKNADRSAYITAMQALREDSFIRTKKKLDKTEQRLEKARSALGKEGLSNVDMIKLKARIKTARKQEDGTVTVVFHKDNAEKVNQALDSIKTQAMKR